MCAIWGPISSNNAVGHGMHCVSRLRPLVSPHGSMRPIAVADMPCRLCTKVILRTTVNPHSCFLVRLQVVRRVVWSGLSELWIGHWMELSSMSSSTTASQGCSQTQCRQLDEAANVLESTKCSPRETCLSTSENPDMRNGCETICFRFIRTLAHLILRSQAAPISLSFNRKETRRHRIAQGILLDLLINSSSNNFHCLSHPNSPKPFVHHGY